MRIRIHIIAEIGNLTNELSLQLSKHSQLHSIDDMDEFNESGDLIQTLRVKLETLEWVLNESKSKD